MDNNENTAAVTEMLLSTESVPKAIIASLAKALLDAAMGTDEGTGKKFHLLSVLRQRHPDTLQKCIDTIGRVDKEKKVSAENVLLKISMVCKKSLRKESGLRFFSFVSLGAERAM